MFKFYLSYVGFMFLLLALLVTSTVSMFVFKQKVHSLRLELSSLDEAIVAAKKKAAMLEANRALHHSSAYLKKISDQRLYARFTTVKQVVAINDLKPSKMASVSN